MDIKNDIQLDNKYVVPYNLDLIVHYQAYSNFEWCNKSRMIKYLFKYMNKGIDRIRAIIIENVLTNDDIGEQQYE